jgi:hypothetical protein
VESTRYSRLSPAVREDDDEDEKFYFGIDIGPYWHEPLGRVFGISATEVGKRARKVVREVLGYSGSIGGKEDARQQLGFYGDDRTYVSHGSYPRVDNQQFYFAYHSLFIVAGQLLVEKPIHHDPEYDEENEFSSWLANHDIARKDGRWLADRRDPVPLDVASWPLRQHVGAKEWVTTDADFSEVLRAGKDFTVWAHWTTADSTYEYSAHVRSALVSQTTSGALLRALHSADDPHGYLIPLYDSSEDINRGKYILQGWIVDQDTADGIDRKDLWSGGVRYPPLMPAAHILGAMGLNSDTDNRIWRSHGVSPELFSQCWGHYEVREDEPNPERGERLQASQEFLCRMLKKLQRSLIFEVILDRRKRYTRFGRYEGDDEGRGRATKIYLLEVDGTVSSL